MERTFLQAVASLELVRNAGLARGTPIPDFAKRLNPGYSGSGGYDGIFTPVSFTTVDHSASSRSISAAKSSGEPSAGR